MIKACRPILLAGLLLSAYTLSAQHDTSWNAYPMFYNHPFRTVKQGSFGLLKGGAWLDANAADNRLLVNVYLKKDLDHDLIKENADKQGAKNLAGSDNNVELSYYALGQKALGRDSLHWFASYGIRDFSGATFSEDLFRLIGLGNKFTEGDTADGNNFRLIRQRYDYLRGGLIWYFPDNSNLSISLGMARGMRLIHVHAKELSLYTAPYGQYMNWNVDIKAKFNRDNEATYGDVNGIGAFIGAEYNRLISGGAFTAGINHLGFMRWFQGRSFTKDTTFTYNGWYVPLFTDLQADAEQDGADSIKRIFSPQRVDGSFTKALPADFFIRYTFKIGKRSALSLQAEQTFFSPMQTLFSGSYYYFGKRFMSVSTLQAGGFGSYNMVQEFAFLAGKSAISVRISGIEGIVAPAFNGGAGGQIAYSYSF